MLEKAIFLVIKQISHPVGVLDEIVVGIGRKIRLNALQTFKEVSGVNSNEPVDADIADIGRGAIESIANVAMFENILTARALIIFFTDLDADQVPFKSSCLE
ncbi:hypothetical protein RCCGE510_29381 (plasmid) [Rhizobium sp. CCGE 510]|nr:hypothetical protein RCCGE510_29381 [Rhizobium sp. CCGE 510]